MSKLSKIYCVRFKKIITRLGFIIIIVLISKFILGVDIFAQTISVNVDLSKKYQTIDNFSASDCWWAHVIGKDWTPANKDSIADLLFSTTKGIGLSACRFNIGAGIDPTITDPWRTVETFEVSPGVYDWSRDSGGQWFLKSAQERGVKQFIAFVNSPPISMTRNGHSYCTDGLGSTNLKNSYLNRYAKYLVDIVKHFRDSLGVNINYVDPVNEPQWEWNGPSQEGNRASDDDIKNIVDSLYTQLKADSVSSKILIPESGSLPDWYTTESSISNKYGKTYGDFLDSLFNNQDISKKTANIFAGHSYWSDLLSTHLVQDRQSLYSHISQYFGFGYKYWVTEYCILQGPNGEGGSGRDLKMTTALNVDRLIHFDLTAANASAWQWWTAVSKYNFKDGLIYTNYTTKGNAQSIIPSKLLWAFGNYSRYIRPGSKRISCTGADNKLGLMASAYVDSASKKIIMVLVNVATTDQKINISTAGLASGQSVKYLTPFVTSNTKGDDLRKYKPFSVDSTYDVPAYSVVTLVGLLNGGIYTAGTPGSPVLESPSAGDTLGAADTAAVWHSIPDAKSYEAYFAYDSTFSNIALDVRGISDTVLSIKDYIKKVTSYPFPPNVLVPNNKYYWRIVASNDSGSGSYSKTRSFFIPENITGIRNSEKTTPSTFYLSQNYPNPFNPSTQIDYSVPSAETTNGSFVQLRIYDILGNKITTLVNRIQKPGNYEVTFNGNNLVSGIYFYKINIGNKEQAKKMVLLK